MPANTSAPHTDHVKSAQDCLFKVQNSSFTQIFQWRTKYFVCHNFCRMLLGISWWFLEFCVFREIPECSRSVVTLTLAVRHHDKFGWQTEHLPTVNRAEIHITSRQSVRRNRCQEDLNSFPLKELEETTRTYSYYVDEDYPARPEIQ